MAAFDRSRAVVVDFPLRGEWRALNAPASRTPSHGTDALGQRFACDFVQMNAGGTALYAHLRNGSVRVRPGDVVESGALLGWTGVAHPSIL